MEYLTTAEVATITRTPVGTVRSWRHVGKGPASFKVGAACCTRGSRSRPGSRRRA